VLDASGALLQCLASVGITGQLDRAKSVGLAHDMQAAARAVGQPTASARR